MRELAELKARHAELDQEVSEAWGVYTDIRDRVNQEKAQLDKEIAAIRKNNPGNASIQSALKKSFELRMQKAKDAEAFKQKVRGSQLDEAIAAENTSKRRKRNAEAVASVRTKQVGSA